MDNTKSFILKQRPTLEKYYYIFFICIFSGLIYFFFYYLKPSIQLWLLISLAGVFILSMVVALYHSLKPLLKADANGLYTFSTGTIPWEDIISIERKMRKDDNENAVEYAYVGILLKKKDIYLKKLKNRVDSYPSLILDYSDRIPATDLIKAIERFRPVL